jgi:hypothetical protein
MYVAVYTQGNAKRRKRSERNKMEIKLGAFFYAGGYRDHHLLHFSGHLFETLCRIGNGAKFKSSSSSQWKEGEQKEEMHFSFVTKRVDREKASGLPDCSWQNIPKRGKIYQIATR